MLTKKQRLQKVIFQYKYVKWAIRIAGHATGREKSIENVSGQRGGLHFQFLQRDLRVEQLFYYFYCRGFVKQLTYIVTSLESDCSSAMSSYVGTNFMKSVLVSKKRFIRVWRF